MSGLGVSLEAARITREGFDASFTLDIPARRITALIGPSGAGKTTILNLIAGFEVPDSGRIVIARRDVGATPARLRPVSMIFQDHNLFAHLDAWTNVALGVSPGLRLDDGERRRIAHAFDRVGLAGLEGRLPGELSGGERQRVAIARALVRDKPVLLLDEPFAALGPALARDMADLIAGIHAERAMTVVFVTHTPADARRLAGHAAFVAAGRIIATGAPDELLARRDLREITDYLGP